ncbi:MAG: helix-turn-helix domain-containing protein [Bacteroidota bacterium]
MDHKFRCDCPITSALDVLGDRWVLVIVKLMLLEGRKTFKEFMASDESIATNILSTKLKWLEEWRLVTKGQLADNRKTNLYHLSDKGLSLTPLIVELALWSDQHLRTYNPTMDDNEGLAQMRNDKQAFTEYLQQQYRAQRIATMGE